MIRLATRALLSILLPIVLPLAATVLLPLLASTAQTPAGLAALDAILEQAAIELRTDLELVVVHRDEIVYRKATMGRGGVGLLGIASASKWLAAGTVQSMVDEGLLSWDDPAGLHLYFVPQDKATITVGQLFSHTSGITSSLPCLLDPGESIESCSRIIAGHPLLHPVGEALQYGDASFQLGARVAEVAATRFWEDLFQRRIAQPLGMRSTTFQPDGAPVQPSVAAGAVSTTDDYLRFVRMLLHDGRWEERRVLSRRGVDLMLADQTRGARIASSFYGNDDALRDGASRNRYGFGNWLEGAADGLPDANSSQGAFGVSPYVDRRRELAFLVFLRDSGVRFNKFYYEIQDVLDAAFPVPEIEPSAAFQPFASITGYPNGGIRVQHRYVPAVCATEGAECPALVVFHPKGSNGRDFAIEAGLIALAERERAILLAWDGLPVAPQTAPEQPPVALQWELTAGFGSTARNDVSLAPLGTAESTSLPGLDPRRVYLLGFREGADVAMLAACQYAGVFAATVLVEPTLSLKGVGEDDALTRVCSPGAPVPVMIWDAPPGEAASRAASPPNAAVFRVSPDPGASPVLPGSFFAAANRCQGSNETEWPAGASALAVTAHTGCRSGAAVLQVMGAAPMSGWPAEGAARAWEFLRGFETPLRARRAAVVTNAASFTIRKTGAGALASLFGEGLSPVTAAAADGGLPFTLSGVRAEFRDLAGVTRTAPLSFVSPGQINLVVPEGLASGMASLFVYEGQTLTHLDWLFIDATAPGLFAAAASGAGPAAGETLYVRPDGTRVSTALARNTAVTQSFVNLAPQPVFLGEPGEIYVTLYGTGWRAAPADSVRVWLGSHELIPVYAGSQGMFAGLDQINLRLDALPGSVRDELVGRSVPLAVCTPDGCSNRLEVQLESGPIPVP